MNKLLLRVFAGWFNDGKRVTALILTGFGLLEPKLIAAGFPLPEGTAAQLAPFIASMVITALSKLDVRIPTAPPT